MQSVLFTTNYHLQLLDSPAWKRTLSFLTLADIESIARISPNSRKRVFNSLQKGQKLIIDRHTLWKYPILSHPNLYREYAAHVTNVEMNGVLEGDLDELFTHFPNLQEVTLRKIHVRETDREPAYPTTPTKVTLVNNNIYYPFLNRWLGHLKSLQTLHLESNGMMTRVPQLPTLLSLTVLDQFVQCQCPALKELTITECWKNIQSADIDLSGLDHLKVIYPVDQRYKEEIESLPLKSKSLQYSHIPEEDTPILRLNEYCLLHLQTFLPSYWWMSFRETHEMFAKLTVIDRFELDRTALKEHSPQNFQQLGPLVSKLVISGLSQENLNKLLPLFTNLVELDFDCKDCYDANIIPSALKRLLIHNTGKMDLEALFRRLNPTLIALVVADIRRPALTALKELRHLQEYKNDRLRSTEALMEFLQTNRESMRSMEIGFKQSSDDATFDLFVEIAQMRNLELLNLHTLDTDYVFTRPPDNSLPLLQKLILATDNADPFLDSLEGSLLRHLDISDCVFMETVTHVLRFTNLEKLRMWIIKDHEILLIVQSLPNLIDLSVHRMDLSHDLMMAVNSYLMGTHRRLRLNEVELG